MDDNRHLNTEARCKIIEARKHVVSASAFFGHLLLDRLVLVEDCTCPTMATDGRSLFYGPAWVRDQWMPHLIFVLCHEVLHCVNHHPARIPPAGDLDMWNEAADYSVNGYLIDHGVGTAPESALYRADLAGNSLEENYSILAKERGEREQDGGGQGDDGPPDQPEPGPDDQDQGQPQSSDSPPTDDGQDAPGDQGTPGDTGERDGTPGDASGQDGQPGPGAGQQYPGDPTGCGSVIPAPMTPEERAEAEADWNVSTLQAAMAAEGMGDLPGDLQRIVDGIRNPEPGWRARLQDWFDQRGRDGCSWCPPNRRYIHLGLYLPSSEAPTLGEVAILVDVSGSIDQDALAAFADHVAGVFDEIKPERVHVIYVNREVTHVESFEGADEFKLEATGGGGTDFRPGFDWLAGEGIEPVGAIYFTDLDCNRYPEEPAYPVLWASTCSHATPPPWGGVINLYD